MTKEILAVDDDRDFREFLEVVMGNEGYTVHAVGSGQEAIEETKKGFYADLVLMDYLMPNLNGVETARKLREFQEYSTTPFIFVTAKTNITNIPDVKELSQDCITKPFDLEQFFLKVRKYIG